MQHWPDRHRCVCMGYLSVKDIVEGINKDRILNLPISNSDLDNAEQIRRDMGSIVGKAIRKRPSLVYKSCISVDKEIILCVDIFYIGGLIFLLSVSRHLNMYMVLHLVNRKSSTLKDLIMAETPAYKSKVFLITYLLNDNVGVVTACISMLNDSGIMIH